ncbi:MAG: alpha/beta hydrolase family protein [Phycisphaerae bacterium]
MRRTRVEIAVLGTLLATSALPAWGGDAKPVERARELLGLFLDGKHAALIAAGDEAVQRELKPAICAQVFAMITLQVGPHQSVKSADADRAGELDRVTFVLQHERGTATLVFTLHANGEMAAFWLRGVDSSASYEPPVYVRRDAFGEEQVSIGSGEFALPGTLCLPNNKARNPAVVLVHGSGPHDEDETILGNKPFRDLAWGLASRDVVVLRYPKRTKAHGERMKPEDINLRFEVIDDAVAAVELLRGRPEVDPARVFVVGHSLGGTLAPEIAVRSGHVAGIISVAGTPRSLVDLVEEQLEYIFNLDGQISPEEQAQLEKARAAAAAIRAGKPEDAKEPLLGAPARYWEELHKLDVLGAARRFAGRMLIVHGGRDYQVPAKCLEAWREGLKDRKGVTFKVYESLNHLMMAGEGKSAPVEYQKTGHVDEAVIRDVTEWIRSADGP